jgi:hypothetical protein
MVPNLIVSLAEGNKPVGFANVGSTFYLDLIEDEARTLDLEGRELPSLQAALSHAHRSLRFFVSQRALEGVIPTQAYIMIRTASGSVTTVTFSDALRLDDEGSSPGA